MTFDKETNINKIKVSSPTIFNRRLIFKLVFGLAALLGVAYLCGAIFREPIASAGTAAMESLGLSGLFLGVIATDACPLPLTNEPLVILSLSAGVGARTIFFVVSAASVTAGIVGYAGGFLVGSRTPLGDWIKRRYPGFEKLMKRYGAIAVALCAFFPIPFAFSTWSAGMTRIGLYKVALASLVRIPKTAFYVWLIVMGWAMGTYNEIVHPAVSEQYPESHSQLVIDSAISEISLTKLCNTEKNKKTNQDGVGYSQSKKELENG